MQVKEEDWVDAVATVGFPFHGKAPRKRDMWNGDGRKSSWSGVDLGGLG